MFIPVPLPFCGVHFDVSPDVMEWFFVFNNDIIKTGLPCELGVDFSGVDGTNTFVLVYDNPQWSGGPIFFGIRRCAQFGRIYGFGRVNGFGNTNNPMHMIGHYHKFIQNHKRKILRDFHPEFLCQFPNFIQFHFCIGNFTKKMLAVFGAYCDKIGTIIGIIPPFCPHGVHAIFVFEFSGHGIIDLGKTRYIFYFKSKKGYR